MGRYMLGGKNWAIDPGYFIREEKIISPLALTLPVATSTLLPVTVPWWPVAAMKVLLYGLWEAWSSSCWSFLSPTLHLLPLCSCWHFTWIQRNPGEGTVWGWTRRDRSDLWLLFLWLPQAGVREASDFIMGKLHKMCSFDCCPRVVRAHLWQIRYLGLEGCWGHRLKEWFLFCVCGLDKKSLNLSCSF